ncbi:MAG: hypothetical protein JXB88_09175 [Spirochaetales bacterium]|nr:hypothetical protein [Spirochaetales bacterium]
MLFRKLSSYRFPVAILTGILIILFYLFFNFNYLSNWLDEKRDARTYNYYVKLGLPRFLYNPHHLYFDRVGQLFYQMMVNRGYSGSSMRILQLRNLIIASICMGLVFFLFYFFSHRYLLSLLFTGLIGFSCAVWIYAHINDTGLIHSILLFILFFTALYFPQAKHKILSSILLALLHSVIVLVFHQSDIIFAFIIFFIMVFSKTLYTNRIYIKKGTSFIFQKKDFYTVQKPVITFRLYNIRYFLLYLLILAIAIIAAYYYIGIVVLKLTLDPAKAGYFNQIKGSTYFFNWIVLYTNIDFWGKGFIKGDLFGKAVKGITTYFYQTGQLNGKEISWDFSAFTAPHAILPNIVILFIFFILICTVILCVFLYKRYNYSFIACLLFLIIYVLFACWWEPDYREFWIAPMFAFWFLAFLVINFLLEKLHGLWPLPQFAVYIFLSVFLGLLFFINFTNLIYPEASREFRLFDIVRNWGYYLKLQ